LRAQAVNKLADLLTELTRRHSTSTRRNAHRNCPASGETRGVEDWAKLPTQPITQDRITGTTRQSKTELRVLRRIGETKRSSRQAPGSNSDSCRRTQRIVRRTRVNPIERCHSHATVGRGFNTNVAAQHQVLNVASEQDFQTVVRRLRPLARRALITARPALVAIRERKPCLRLRRRVDGWYVRFMTAKLLGTLRLSRAHLPTRRNEEEILAASRRQRKRGTPLTSGLWTTPQILLRCPLTSDGMGDIPRPDDCITPGQDV
jgi:hypothetical protein